MSDPVVAATAADLWKIVGVALAVGGAAVGGAGLLGIVTKILDARWGESADDRADREQLRKELADMREVRRDETARADSLADKLEVLNRKLDAFRAAIRALIDFAREQRHTANDRIMAAYQAGRVAERSGNGEAGELPPGLPQVPKLEHFLPGDG